MKLKFKSINQANDRFECIVRNKVFGYTPEYREIDLYTPNYQSIIINIRRTTFRQIMYRII